MEERVQFGCGVVCIVVSNGQVLLGRRALEPWLGMWSFPGGHLEYGESVIDAAKRELFEETGLVTDSMTAYAPIVTYEYGPFVGVPVECGVTSEEYKLTEAFDRLGFFPMDGPPDNMFPPALRVLQQCRCGWEYLDGHY